jgi:hypothetical protein
VPVVALGALLAVGHELLGTGDEGDVCRSARVGRELTHRTVEGGIGHNLPQEAPDAFADAILEVGGGGK